MQTSKILFGLVFVLAVPLGAVPAVAQTTGSGTVDIRFTGFDGPARLSGPDGPILTGTVNGLTPDFATGVSFDTGRGNDTTYDTASIGGAQTGGPFPLTGTPTTRVSLLDGEATVGSPFENIFSWTPATFSGVAVGQNFTLGTLTFQNGSWFGAGVQGAANVTTGLGFRISTISSSGAQFNQQRNLTLTHTVNAPFPNDTTTLAGQQAAADWITISDDENGITLNSFRVYDFGIGPPGSSNVGSVDLIGRFGSLSILGFANPTGGFLTDGDLPLPPVIPGGGGSGPVPEPANWAMLIAGFGLIGAMQRGRRTWVRALPA